MRTRKTPPLTVFLVFWYLTGCQISNDWGTDKRLRKILKKSSERSSWPEDSLFRETTIGTGEKIFPVHSSWSNVAHLVRLFLGSKWDIDQFRRHHSGRKVNGQPEYTEEHLPERKMSILSLEKSWEIHQNYLQTFDKLSRKKDTRLTLTLRAELDST